MSQRYDAAVRIHDHMDGSAHCVECAVKCKLEGAEMVLTALVRWLLESESLGYGKLAYQPKKFLIEHGVDVDKRLPCRARLSLDLLRSSCGICGLLTA